MAMSHAHKLYALLVKLRESMERVWILEEKVTNEVTSLSCGCRMILCVQLRVLPTLVGGGYSHFYHHSNSFYNHSQVQNH